MRLPWQQLLCMRISAVMQAHNSCCATDDTDCLNNISYLFQQLHLSLPTTSAISSNNFSYLVSTTYQYYSNNKRGCIINF